MHLIKLLTSQNEQGYVLQHVVFIVFPLFADSKYELASIQNGGFLKIYQVDSNQDAGTYTCIVRNSGGEEARREMELTVNSMWNVAWQHTCTCNSTFFLFSSYNFIAYRFTFCRCVFPFFAAAAAATAQVRR